MRIPKRNLNINDISLVDSLYQLVAEFVLDIIGNYRATTGKKVDD